MTCARVTLADGADAWLCSRGRRAPSCRFCGAPADRQCDYPLTGRRAGETCDVYMCPRCAVTELGKGPDGDSYDLCLPHAKLVRQQHLDLGGRK
jgi:hypothetical protein